MNLSPHGQIAATLWYTFTLMGQADFLVTTCRIGGKISAETEDEGRWKNSLIGIDPFSIRIVVKVNFPISQ
jgi:hypothetical protein